MGRSKVLGRAPVLVEGTRMTFREKLGRLGERFKESEWREMPNY
jgi:hypothetical protein